MYYIILTTGKKVEDALSDMLDSNTNSSRIKGNNSKGGTLDYWYYTNVEQKGYSSYIEDTVWCNDRSIDYLGGWDPDGGSTKNELFFRESSNDYQQILNCSRKVDRFTVSSSNGNGDLDYPVGLITADEIKLAGGCWNISNSSFYLYTGKEWWTTSPYKFTGNGAYSLYLGSNGSLNSNYIDDSKGVRPSISLKNNVVVTSGEGTVNKPFVIQIK